MYLMQAKMQAEQKKRLFTSSVVQEKKQPGMQTMQMFAASKQYRQPFGVTMYMPVNSQKGVIQLQGPSVRERTKNATVGDRHNIPNPFLDLGGWYKTLMAGRIADLFLTQGGFLGHAQQIQQELTRLDNVMDYMEPDSLEAVYTYINNIKQFIIKGAKYAQFDFPQFVFKLINQRTLTIEKQNHILMVNSRPYYD